MFFTEGKPQTIKFPRVADVKADSPLLESKATSNSGLPVDYHVAYGLAKIIDGELDISELPLRANYPIMIKIVAYESGRGVEPLVQTSSPVERTIRILVPNR